MVAAANVINTVITPALKLIVEKMKSEMAGNALLLLVHCPIFAHGKVTLFLSKSFITTQALAVSSDCCNQ